MTTWTDELVEQLDLTLTEDQRVTNGVTWLDEVRPAWWTELDLDTLDLGDGGECVLGQIVRGECNKDWDNVITEDLENLASAGFDALVEHDQWPILSEVDDLESVTLTIPQSVNRGFHITWVNAEGQPTKDSSAVRAEYKRLTALWAAVVIDRRVQAALNGS